WQDILHIERVGRHDNFFDLGGHSLLVIQMIERLRQLGLQTDIRSIFNATTLAALSISLNGKTTCEFIVLPNLIPPTCGAITPEMLTLVELDQDQIDRIVQTVPGGASNVQDIYPLAPLQEGILFHHLLSEQGDAYILPVLLALETRAQLDKFLSALQAVIDRHDILRSAVIWKDLPKPMQVVYRHAELPVQVIELDSAQDPIEQLKARIEPQYLRMDLQQAPLVRIQIAADAHTAQWFMVLQLHHLVSDHVSLEIVVSEVLAHLAGHADRLPAPIAYRGFVAQALARAEHHDAEAFFRARLTDIDEPTLPFGLLDVHGDGSQIEEAQQAVDAALAQRVRSSARHLSVSAAALFHVAWALVVARSSGRDDVVFGSVLSGRLQGTEGADRVVGMFINTLPLRLQLKGAKVRQIVQDTQRELVELLAYEQTSLALAQRCSAVPASMPLFSAMLNYRHSAPMETGGMGNELGIHILASQERTNYPFDLSVDDLGEGFSLVAQTDRRVNPNRVTAYMHTALEALVQALEAAPDTEILDLAILPANERRQVLEEFNAT
ncbi:MAG: non-ribosomal peptide synthetase, partial [Rhodocyclaceae bacterium]|nr:non-ribosomal peptide synthetase [Rhodocyclaceae bacterium]